MVSRRGEGEHGPTESQASGSTLEMAVGYWRSGLNLLPCALRSKTPLLKTWKRCQAQLQTEVEVTTLFCDHQCNIAVVCEPVSGNLGVLEGPVRGMEQGVRAPGRPEARRW